MPETVAETQCLSQLILPCLRFQEKRLHSTTFSSVKFFIFFFMTCIRACVCLSYANTSCQCACFDFIFLVLFLSLGSIDRDSDIGDARSLLDLDVMKII